MSLIIASQEKLYVGQITTDLFDERCRRHKRQAFKVMGIRTAYEWEQEYLASGGDAELAKIVTDFCIYFYEIHTD